MKKCKHCGADFGLHQFKTEHCPEGGLEAVKIAIPGKKERWATTVFETEPVSNGYTEALEKAAQTAYFFLKDVQALYPLAQGVAESDLFYGYIEQAARMKGTLNRIVAEKTTVK